MKEKLFSIVIPTLNEELFIGNLLQDLKGQREKDFEVIIVDGMSTDKTLEKVRIHEHDFPLQILTSDKRNVSVQRNLGAKHAKGKFLIFLDADFRIFSTFVKKLKASVIKKSGLLFIPTILPEQNDPQSKFIFTVANAVIEASYSFGKPLSAGGDLCIEKNFFLLLGGFDETLFMSEDHNLVQKAYKMGVKARILKEVKVIFSLRRFRQEGQLKLVYKYILSIFYFIAKGNIKKKIYSYDMGGHVYKDPSVKQAVSKIKTDETSMKRFFRHVSSLVN